MKKWLAELFGNSVIIAKIVLLVGVPAALLVAHVHNQYRLAQVGYQLAEATSEHQQLLEENKKLVVEARLQGRSDRVTEVAQREFGLRHVSPEQIVTIDDRAHRRPTGEHAHLDDGIAPAQGPVIQ